MKKNYMFLVFALLFAACRPVMENPQTEEVAPPTANETELFSATEALLEVPSQLFTPDPRVDAYEWVQVSLDAGFPARDGAGALVFKDRMWLIGGWNPFDQEYYPMITSNDVWSSDNGVSWVLEKPNTFTDTDFDPTSDWEGRHSAGYVVFDGKMWIIGGDLIQEHYQTDIWNSNDGIHWTWVNEGQPAPWNPRVLHYTVVHDGRIWVMGGQTIPNLYPTDESYFKDVWTTTDGVHWEKVLKDPSSWTARGMIVGSAVFDEKIWVMGGGTYPALINQIRDFYNDIWYSEDGINWVRRHAGAPWSPRSYHNVAVFDGLMWVLGGNIAEGDLNDVWFSSDGVYWSELPNTPWAIRHAASIFVYDNSLWVVAGRNMQSDVWRLNILKEN
jgi:hypothetical protein